MDDLCRAQMQEVTDAIASYLLAVLQDGDYLNDWLTHVPQCGQDSLQLLGQMLAIMIGV